MEKNEYFLEIAHALSGCQLVEEHLKLYITEAFQLAAKCIGERMPFKLCGEDYADAPLGRLIDMFKKLSYNNQLVTALNKFRCERNFLSHKGITHCLDYDGQLCITSAEKMSNRLADVQTEAKRLCREIHLETNKFSPHLHFWDVPKES